MKPISILNYNKLWFAFLFTTLFIGIGYGQFVIPGNTEFLQQWQHGVDRNISLDSRRAWYISPRLGEDVNMSFINNGLEYSLSSIQNGNKHRVRNLNQYIFDNVNNVDDFISLDYNNLMNRYPSDDYFFKLGDIKITIAAGKHESQNDIHNSPLAGMAPKSTVDLVTNRQDINISPRNLARAIQFIAESDRHNITDILILEDNKPSGSIAQQQQYINEIRTGIANLEAKNVITITPQNSLYNPNLEIISSNTLYSIYVGGSMDNGLIDVNTNPRDYLAFLAPKIRILQPVQATLNPASYRTQEVAAAGSNESITGGVVALILSEMKNDEDGQDRAQRAWVKKMMQTTAEKITGFENYIISFTIPTAVNNFNLTSKFYTTPRINSHGHGFLNAHQSLLLTKAYILDQPNYTYTPNPLLGMNERIMPWDKVMFDKPVSNGPSFALALNKNRVSAYRLPKHRDDVNDTGYLLWDMDQPLIDNLPFAQQYISFISLYGQNFSFVNANGDIAFRIPLPFPLARRLESYVVDPLIGQPDSPLINCKPSLLEFIPVIGGAFAPNVSCISISSTEINNQTADDHNTESECRNTANATFDYDYDGDPDCIDPEMPTGDTKESSYKAQWFEVIDQDDKSGKNNYKASDLVVKRQVRNGKGKSKTLVVWSSSKGLIDNDEELHRHLYEDLIYDEIQVGDKITTSDWLHDNEIMYSPNREHRILHHKGIVVSQQKDMPVVDNQEVWRDKWVVDTTNPSSSYYKPGFADYNAHRLRLTREGQMQYIAGDEDDSEQLIEKASVNIGIDCDGLGTDSDYAFQLLNDGRMITYNGNNIPLNLIIADHSSSTNELNTQKKLIPIPQTPQANETTNLLSPDGSKLSFFDDQSINVVQNEANGFFCLNKVIQKYTP